ncbi:TatD family hydrolase [Thermodesulfitimonas autotrophica]|uniref:TatD family hydrolase n=1 Tax=Thermodesulfitimonas autotrophica TaxID=1894989 RepID=UPI002FE013A7
MTAELTDTHCHLDDERYETDRAAVVARARAAGVTRLVTVGYDLASSRRTVELAAALPGVYAVVGVHPHDAAGVSPEYLEELRRLAREPCVVAIGEIGLDFYRDLSPRPAQREVFVAQLNLARELGLPVVIHCREALGEVYAILRREAVGLSGVMHCFSGGWEEARRFLALGFYLSVAGPVTFAGARRPVEVVRQMPIERLLLETDAPYLAPVPHRGKRNEPAYLVHTAQKVAEIRGISLEELAAATTANAARLFGLPTF